MAPRSSLCALLLVAQTALAQLSVTEPSLPCLLSPRFTVQAGDELAFQLMQNTPCEATVAFADPSFLPITWTTIPQQCFGDQIVRFQIPENAPNGMAALQWHCAGSAQASCSTFDITAGKADPSSFLLESKILKSRVDCIAGDGTLRSNLTSSRGGVGTGQTGTFYPRPTGRPTGYPRLRPTSAAGPCS
ncbi:hypothetical protein NA57DRAFT_52776 [Rhizodiscina lignyota]|uniref:Uncharacterized protein n=1 Tax=Rhizodiscina lignyota TaxID=1504668 RepID=A0A9P4INN0_9PEZI|nr:hypothetical protein NA57DRAFT_52776 [Rhizodiscina lignyota]